MIGLTANETNTESLYMGRAPFNLAAYNVDSHKDRVLTWCKDAFEALGIWEQLARTDRFAANLLEECLWPCNVWAREALISCFECDHKRLGQCIEKDIDHIVEGIGAKPVEDTHRELNVAQRQNVNIKLGRAARWNAAISSNVLANNDILTPKVRDADKGDSKRASMTNNTFDCVGKSKDFSLGSDVWAQLLEKDRNFTLVKIGDP